MAKNLPTDTPKVKTDTPQDALKQAGVGIVDMPAPDFSQSDTDCQPPVVDASQGKKQPYFQTFDAYRDTLTFGWRVKGVLPAKGIGAIFGDSGAGKSFFALDMALTILKGNDWFGHKTKQKGPVVYICLEGQAGFVNRLKAWEEDKGERIPDNLLLKFSDFELGNLSDEEIQEFPDDALVIFDTLNAVAPTIEENSSTGMGMALEAAKRIQKKTSGLVLLIHHCGKDDTKGLRGHSSLHAAMDVEIKISGNGTKTWQVTKSKDGESGIKGNFTLRQVHLGEDEDGDAVTSCVVEPVESCDFSPQEAKLAPALREALDVLKRLCEDAKTDEILTEKWRKEMEKISPMRKESKRGSFYYRRKELLKHGYIAENLGMTRILRQA